MEAEGWLVDADYRIRQGEPVVRLFLETDEGGLTVEDTGFSPYFYAVPSGDAAELEHVLEDREFEDDGEQLPVRRVERVTRTDGNAELELLQVHTSVPPKVPKLRKRVSELEEVEDTREFDIPFYKRYLIDKGLVPAERYRVEGEESGEAVELGEIERLESDVPEFDCLAFDLEVVDGEIVMCSFASAEIEKVVSTAEIDAGFVETVEDEQELLASFVETVESSEAEVLTGYNTDEYDFRRLREAAQRAGTELRLGPADERVKFDRRGRFSSARIKGRMHLDLYPFVAHVLAPGLDSETLDLDSVAEEMLGENKQELEFERMREIWRSGENLQEMAEYALKDSRLALQLGREIVPQVSELSRITGLIPFDTCRLTYGQLTENFLLREAFERGMVSPNRPFESERRKRRNEGAYEGGFVYSPEPGLYDGIAVLDFASLYPTVMVSHNISPETLDVDGCEDEFEIEELGYGFCQDSKGFFPELIQRLVEERNSIKQQMESAPEEEMVSLRSRSQARKILANSFYGYLGYEGARWYSREAAEATTFLGREYIRDAIDTAEEMELEVVYGDTDSVMLQGENIDQRVEQYLERVNAELPEFMELEMEGYFERGFFTSKESGEGAKKKYALLDPDGEMKITGFEFVRRDWSPIAKETQKEVLRLVLEEKPEEAAELVKKTVERMRSGEIDVKKLKIYTTLTKSPEEYDSTAPHVEAVKKANRRGEEIEPETTVDYVVTSGSGSISERAELTKYAESYDADYYIDSQIVPVAYRVLKVFGYTEDQLKGKGRQSGLGRFG
jgi:DNA polymerase elongation subunit (family B)